jgi:DUF4097 and DUF4098 domain-containing protein YvlB
MKGKWIIAGALILMEIALCGGIMGSVWAGIDAIGNLSLRLGDFRGANVSATADEEQTLEADGPLVLSVNKGTEAAFGDVTVKTGTGTEVVVLAHKVAWGADMAAAQAALDELDVQVTQSGNTVDIHVSRPEEAVFVFGDITRSQVDFTITVPADTTVNAVTDFGNITISDTSGDANLNTNFGDITVTGVSDGSIDAVTDFGEITLSSLEVVNVIASSNAGDINLSNVQATGSVEVNTEFGEVQYQDGAAKSLDVHTNSGDLDLDSITVDRELIAKTEFGSITLTQVEAATYDVKTNSGRISLEGTTGEITADTEFGDVSVTDAQNATLTLSTNSGTIEFSGALGDGPHSMHSEFGNIRLAIPEDTALDVDLQTDFGGISSDIPVATRAGDDDDHWTGEMNGGGTTLTVQTNSGEISIEIFNP